MGLERGGSSSAVLRVRLLGSFDLRLGDTPLPPLGSVRAEALLAYLLLHRDMPQQRQRLAFLLWPDSTESQARTNLRQVLHKLRRDLPEADRYIDVQQRTLGWRPGAPMWVDVAQFEEAIATGRLEEAVELYAGPLLEALYDEWLLEERERLSHLYADALDALTQRVSAERRWPEALAYAERLVRADPLREHAYRAMMRVHHASGDRTAAVRSYHRCATTLQRELGVDPSEETRRLYEDVLAAEQSVLDTVASDRPPLVGRATERARLMDAWRLASGGSPRLVMVTGEAGIGKTRLLDELLPSAVRSGAIVAEARAYHVEGAMAYGLVSGWLRSEPVASRLERLAPLQLSALARLVPDLASANLPTLEPTSEEEERRRLFAALVQAVLAPGVPVLLLADDVHWADSHSLAFIHFLLRSRADAPVLVAATARWEEVASRHPLSELVTALRGLDRYAEIQLERLNRGETAVLVERMLGTALDRDEAERLFSESEGNPLFVVEAVRGGLAPTTGGRVQAVIDARLAQLSEPAAELIGVAATIGRAFTSGLLLRASGMDTQTFVQALDELWRRGLVRSQDAQRYDFSHGKIQEAAHDALGPVRSRDHHVRVAQALQDGATEAVSAEIAAHYDTAGSADEAVGWYRRAAEVSQRLHASADAARYLERALELLERLPADDARDAVELELLTMLPVALLPREGYFSGRVGSFLDRAIDVAHRLGVEPEPPLVRSLAVGALARGDFRVAYEFGERLRDRAVRDADQVVQVEAAYVLGIAAYWQGYLDAARIQFEYAIENTRPEHRSVHLVRYAQDPEVVCRTRLAHALWLMGRPDDAHRMRDAGFALALEIEHGYTIAVAVVWSALLALEEQDYNRLRADLDAIDQTAPEFRGPHIRLVADALVALMDIANGRREALVGVRDALESALQHDAATPGFHAVLMRLLLQAYADADEPRAGLVLADRALATPGIAVWEPEVRRLRASFLHGTGAPVSEVEDELRRGLTVATGQGARPFEARIREDLNRFHVPAS